jgi:Flp pilus assembly protein TadD
MVITEAHHPEPGFIGREDPDPSDKESADDSPPLHVTSQGGADGEDERLAEDPPVGSVTEIPVAHLDDKKPEPPTDSGPPSTGQPVSPRQGHVTPEEKEQLLSKLEKVSPSRHPDPAPSGVSEDAGQPKSPEAQPAMPAPQMARRGRGIAYFYRNFIQLGGRPLLRPGEEIIIGDRAYELRPRKFDTRFIIGGAAAALLVVLAIVASLVVGGTNTGSGDIVGVVLDEYGQPFLQGAEVHLPDRELQVTSNAQGFFRFEDLPAGPYEFRLISGGAELGRNHATVVGGETSTLLLFPDTEVGRQTRKDQTDETAGTHPDQSYRSEESKNQPNRQTTTRSRSERRSWASIRVESNVGNPRLRMDGEVLGTGNTRYVKLKPGRHSYIVEAEGYAPAKGTVDLPAGEMTTLAVNLERTVAEENTFQTPDDIYLLGTAAASDGDHREAISRFTEVLEKAPKHAAAFEARGKSHLRLDDPQAAYKDFLQGALIRRNDGEVNRAITDFNKALEINENSLTAYLGRGETYLAKREPFAAVADFDAAISLDEESFAAHFGLGRARYQQRQYERALDHFERAQKIDPRQPRLYRYMMLCYFANDEFDEVRDSYESFVEFASPAETDQLRSNPEFSAVMRVVD